MKKNKLKLNLRKDIISKLQIRNIRGGRNIDDGVTVSEYDYQTDCTSEAGCTDGPDETMTCAAWGCPGNGTKTAGNATCGGANTCQIFC